MGFRAEISLKRAIDPGIFFPHTSGAVIEASKTRGNVTVFPGAKEVNMGFDQPQALYGRLLGLDFVPRFLRGCLWAIMQ
jgi:hypothetical protein